MDKRMVGPHSAKRAPVCRSRGRPGWLGRVALAALLTLAGPWASGDSRIEEEGGLSYTAEGRASYYSSRLHGRRTASGEPYDESEMTAAHPSLPFDSMLCVTNLYNGRSTEVRVNDRGPFVGNRIIDLSMAAAKELGMLRAGTVRVRVEDCSEIES